MNEDAEDRDSPGDASEQAATEDVETLVEEDPAAAFEQGAGIPGTHVRAMEFWDDIVADMEATADEYESEGWEAHQLHPGDVTTRSPDPESDDDLFGLDVLVPNNEFDAVEELLEGGVAFDAYEAFRATGDGLVLLMVAMEDNDEEVAVLYPAYYDPQDAQAMLAVADRESEMRTYLRTLTNERIEFTHEDPGNFTPPTGEDAE